MKYDIKTDQLNNDKWRWQVLLHEDGSQVKVGITDQPGQARHDAMEARRMLPDNPALEQAYYELIEIEPTLACAICDEQEKAEEQVRMGHGSFDDFTDQENGERLGIVYMENAAPELDEARGHVQEAYALLHTYIKQQEENQDG